MRCESVEAGLNRRTATLVRFASGSDGSLRKPRRFIAENRARVRTFLGGGATFQGALSRIKAPAVSKVSVIIPVKDRHDLLRYAVSSALGQTYPIHEVIIVDDGSITPITRAHVGSTDGRLKIIRLSRNSGAGAARNAGIKESTGALLAFLDSDDVWFEDKLQAQVEHYWAHAASSDLVAIVCGWDVVFPGSPPTFSRHPLPSVRLKDFASGCWFSPGSTLLIGRGAFDKVGLFSPQLRRLEDFEWFLRFALAGGRLCSAPVIGASIRQGRRARYADVCFAARKIVHRFGAEAQPSVPKTAYRRLRAWLQVELAAAARNERRWGLLFWHLALSFCLVPRNSIEIKRWWSVAQPRGPQHAQDKTDLYASDHD